MKHRAPQFELPMPEAPFNLAGQTIRQEQPQPAPVKDTLTRDIFQGLNGVFYRYEPSVGVACAVTPQPKGKP